MKRKNALPKAFIARCKAVTAKRPRTVIDHILKHGHITTDDLKDRYGYNHPPRAVRDVKENGIPIEMFRVTGKDGRKIAAYRFGDPATVRLTKFSGRTALSNKLRQALIAKHGSRCAVYLEEFPERELQIDHRVPYEVGGEPDSQKLNLTDFMLLCSSANRAKSWSCEHCENWRQLKNPGICRECYWASPEGYTHVAMREERRLDILWSGAEVVGYDKLKAESLSVNYSLPKFVKDILTKRQPVQ